MNDKSYRKSFTLNPISKKTAGITILITFPYGAQGSDLASFFEDWSRSENISEIKQHLTIVCVCLTTARSQLTEVGMRST